MGRIIKVNKTQKPGYKIYFVIQETDLCIKTCNILVQYMYSSDFLCNDDFHNATLDTFAIIEVIKQLMVKPYNFDSHFCHTLGWYIIYKLVYY